MQSPQRHQFWARLGFACVERPRLTLALSALLAALFAHQLATRLQVDTSIEAVLAGDSDAVRVLDELQDTFGEDAAFEVHVEGDVFSASYLDRLRELHERLRTLPIPELDARLGAAPTAPAEPSTAPAPSDDEIGFGDDEDTARPSDATPEAHDADTAAALQSPWADQVLSLVNARETRMKNDALAARALMTPWPEPSALPALRERVLGDPRLVGQVVNAEGKGSVIIVRPVRLRVEDQALVHRAVERVAREFDAPGFRVDVGGVSALEDLLSQLTVHDMVTLTAAAHVFTALVLLLLYRHPLGALGPVLVIVQGMLCTLGAMALTGTPLTILGSVLPGFLTAVGVADAIHLQSAYRGLRARRVDNTRAIKLALRRTASPIVFTSLTTAAGLFSLQMASMDAIRQLGLFGGLGVLVELLLTLTFLPAFLTFNRRSLFGARRHERGLFVRLDDLVARLAAVRGKTPARTQRITLAITAALTLAALAYIPRIDVTHDLLGHIPDGDDPHPAFEALDARMGGAANIILLMHARGERGMADRELLLGLEQLEAHLARYRDPRTGERVTGASLSVLDPIRETWLALHDRDRAFDAIPETQRGVHNALTMFENAARDDLRRLVTLDRRTGVMVVRTRWMDARSYTQLVEHVQRGIATHIGDRARVAITGSVFNQFWISQQVVRDMLDSLGLAFVLVLVLIVLLLRDVRVGLVAMVPNVMPVIWVLGYMGASRTPLDPPSVLVFSVVLGIVVDDTIHFFHHFMSHFRRRKHLGAALTHTFDRVSRAMILTTLLLCCEFTIMILADMGSIRTFAVLTTIALFGALWADLVIGPALLRLMFRQTHDKPATSPQARPALS